MARINLTPDTNLDLQIGRDWIKSLALAAICIFVLAASIYGVLLDPSSATDRRFHNSSFVILPVFLGLSVFVLYRLVAPWGAPVRLGPSGFTDLRAGSKTIPWDQISNVVTRGEFMTLTLRRGFTKTYRMSLTQRILKARRKSAGPNHLLVADWCLSTSKGELAQLVTAYRTNHTAPPKRSPAKKSHARP